MVISAINDLAQVNYPFGSFIGGPVKKLVYDLCYVKYMSITLDLRILF